ncbi:MAG TPA: hypothetical protein VMB79_07030 [Jatrophihabitans sp.]|nr:hypothetical protein [Jatrophihabitans sp.]
MSSADVRARPPLGPAGRPAWARPAPVAVWLATGLATAAFLLARLPVSDLQAAQARAAASRAGAGVTYWLGWFGGAVPGRYSVLSGWLGGLLGVRLVAAAAVLGIVGLGWLLLAGVPDRAGGLAAIAVAATATLWSGRVAFCLGGLVAMAGLCLLERGNPWAAGAVNVLAALLSPLAAAFAALGCSGWLAGQPAQRAGVLRYLAVSAAGLASLLWLFGTPGTTPFDTATMLKTAAILLLPQALPLPRPVRVTLGLALLGCLGAYLVPLGVGGNLTRFALTVMPPLVWATARGRRRWVLGCLAPAAGYAAILLGVDLTAASGPAGQAGYYAPLVHQVAGLPGRAGFRLEALDTPTHRSSAELVAVADLARGWDLQADAAANPLFYGGQPLTAASYDRWLRGNAVGWVAVPDDLNAHNRQEGRLIASGLPYLRPIWQDRHWRLYAVRSPAPIVPAPARLAAESGTSLTVAVPAAGTVELRVRPSKFLCVTGPGTGRLSSAGPELTALQVDRAGVYRISALSAPGWLGRRAGWAGSRGCD